MALHNDQFKQPKRTSLNDGPYIEKVRCEGVLIGGKRCRRTRGVEACFCGCSLDLCPKCMGKQGR